MFSCQHCTVTFSVGRKLRRELRSMKAVPTMARVMERDSRLVIVMVKRMQAGRGL